MLSFDIYLVSLGLEGKGHIIISTSSIIFFCSLVDWLRFSCDEYHKTIRRNPQICYFKIEKKLNIVMVNYSPDCLAVLKELLFFYFTNLLAQIGF